MKVSVIIPVYNEEKVIRECLESLAKQTKKLLEIIVVDDGSTDTSVEIIKNLKSQISNLKLFTQNHKGPGAARNLGAKKATGEILVFVDSDMTFTPEFIEKLIEPIEEKKSKGTFSREEFVSNWNNVWSKCWSYNQNISDSRRIPKDYPDTAPVFRAILKSEFDQVGGFTEGVGWTDDWSLSKKLGYKSTATNAVCYHANPSTLSEVFYQARWIGKNEFLAGGTARIILNCLRFSFPISLIMGLFIAIRYQTFEFVIFKLVYDMGISAGLLTSISTSDKNK